jgi:hypothetical protein
MAMTAPTTTPTIMPKIKELSGGQGGGGGQGVGVGIGHRDPPVEDDEGGEVGEEVGWGYFEWQSLGVRWMLKV